MPKLALLFLIGLYALSPHAIHAEEKLRPFEFKEGDRIVFLGSTWIEREQLYGYWEAALTVAHPDKKLTFRNLGRSGDTVWGDAWAAFDTAKEGYQRRLQLVKEQKPTVIFLGFGWNESFAGAKGLAGFQTQYRQLVKDLQTTGARFVFLEPPPVLDCDRFVKDIPKRRADQDLYGKAISELAAIVKGYYRTGGKGGSFLYQGFYHEADLDQQGTPLTPLGYYASAQVLLAYLGPSKPADSQKKDIKLLSGEKYEHTASLLVSPPPPSLAKPGTFIQPDSLVRTDKLQSGKYSLKIDGQVVLTASAEEWNEPKFPVINLPSEGMPIPQGPSLAQSEQLRKLIIEKNQLFFHRSRPQNETYLFGFRKHEQGQNAKEVPEFDPLIEALEKKTDELKKPKSHTYELVRIGD